MTVKRGDIYYADLSPVVGCRVVGAEQMLIDCNRFVNAVDTVLREPPRKM